MGMFDDLHLADEITLPDGFKGRSFQTKCLDCELSQYRITADGALEIERCDYEPDGPPGPHPFLTTITDWQKQKRVNIRWEPVAHHGDIFFYTYTGDINSDDGVDWHEYRARFTEGRMTSLTDERRPGR